MSAQVDVLDTMHDCAMRLRSKKCDLFAADLDEARAAVAALIAERDALREALKEVEDCAEYWSEYFVPVGLPDRIRAALAVGESA